MNGSIHSYCEYGPQPRVSEIAIAVDVTYHDDAGVEQSRRINVDFDCTTEFGNQYDLGDSQPVNRSSVSSSVRRHAECVAIAEMQRHDWRVNHPYNSQHILEHK